MKCNPSLVAPLAGVICLLSPHAGHAADAVREAAIQFAGGWAETVAVFGVASLSDPRAFLEHKDKLDPHRKVIRESGLEGIKAGRGAARQTYQLRRARRVRTL